MRTLKTGKFDAIWLMNVNILFKLSANIKDCMGKFIMPLESEMKEMKETLGYLTNSVEESKDKGKLSSPILLLNFGIHFDLKKK